MTVESIIKNKELVAKLKDMAVLFTLLSKPEKVQKLNDLLKQDFRLLLILRCYFNEYSEGLIELVEKKLKLSLVKKLSSVKAKKAKSIQFTDSEKEEIESVFGSCLKRHSIILA